MTISALLWICGLLALFAPSVGAVIAAREAGELLLVSAKCRSLVRQRPYSRTIDDALLAVADGLRDRSEAIIAHGYGYVLIGAMTEALLIVLLIAPH